MSLRGHTPSPSAPGENRPFAFPTPRICLFRTTVRDGPRASGLPVSVESSRSLPGAAGVRAPFLFRVSLLPSMQGPVAVVRPSVDANDGLLGTSHGEHHTPPGLAFLCLLPPRAWGVADFGHTPRPGRVPRLQGRGPVCWASCARELVSPMPALETNGHGQMGRPDSEPPCKGGSVWLPCHVLAQLSMTTGSPQSSRHGERWPDRTAGQHHMRLLKTHAGASAWRPPLGVRFARKRDAGSVCRARGPGLAHGSGLGEWASRFLHTRPPPRCRMTPSAWSREQTVPLRQSPTRTGLGVWAPTGQGCGHIRSRTSQRDTCNPGTIRTARSPDFSPPTAGRACVAGTGQKTGWSGSCPMHASPFHAHLAAEGPVHTEGSRGPHFLETDTCTALPSPVRTADR